MTMFSELKPGEIFTYYGDRYIKIDASLSFNCFLKRNDTLCEFMYVTEKYALCGTDVDFEVNNNYVPNPPGSTKVRLTEAVDVDVDETEAETE